MPCPTLLRMNIAWSEHATIRDLIQQVSCLYAAQYLAERRRTFPHAERLASLVASMDQCTADHTALDADDIDGRLRELEARYAVLHKTLSPNP